MTRVSYDVWVAVGGYLYVWVWGDKDRKRQTEKERDTIESG